MILVVVKKHKTPPASPPRSASRHIGCWMFDVGCWMFGPQVPPLPNALVTARAHRATHMTDIRR
ncbi:hypothetical protein Ga0100231_001075 [Opitutaceae bacterium TAV4]|nr:hypothetical protein Ga0100231_001075 [Opitutaceae bacterium TAV4]